HDEGPRYTRPGYHKKELLLYRCGIPTVRGPSLFRRRGKRRAASPIAFYGLALPNISLSGTLVLSVADRSALFLRSREHRSGVPDSSPRLRIRSTPPREKDRSSTCHFGQVRAIAAARESGECRPNLAGRRPV